MPLTGYRSAADQRKALEEERLNTEVNAANTPDPAARSAALDQLQASLTKEAPLAVQDYSLVKTQRPKGKAPPLANILMDTLRKNLQGGM